MARPARRRRSARRVAFIGLVLASAFAAAAIVGLMRVARAPDAGPYRFPPPTARPAPG